MLLFFLLKTIFSFNSGKIKVKKTRITIILTINPYLSPSEMQKCNRIIIFKKKRNLKQNYTGAQMAAYIIHF